MDGKNLDHTRPVFFWSGYNDKSDNGIHLAVGLLEISEIVRM